MEKHVCPWWIGSILASPVRKVLLNPMRLLSPYIKEGMTVLDIGPGMGFFTIPAAGLAGEKGRVIAVDLQKKMLSGLKKRARKKGLDVLIETRLCSSDSLGIDDLAGSVDIALAIAMIHEVPDVVSLFSQIHRVLKKGGKLLVSEPKGHVSVNKFNLTLDTARKCGFTVSGDPVPGRSRSALLVK